MKTVFTTLLFLILTTQAIGGLFVGVAIVEEGLVILQPAEAGVGSGRIVKQVRLELGDLVRVGDDGVCRICLIDGTIVRLTPNSEYRVRREGLWKVLDGGEMVIADFQLVLGSKTQKLSVKTTREKLGELTPLGDCQYKNSYDTEWKPVTKGTPFHSGGMIKTGPDGKAIVTYNELSVLAMIEPDSLVYCLRDGVNFEKGKGLISVASGGGAYMFDASMSRIRVRTKKALFHFQELKDGAYLSVYKGRLQFALKAQGLPTSVTMGPGFKAVLKRSGLIKRPERFKAPEDIGDIDESIGTWFAGGQFDKLQGFLEGRASVLSPGKTEQDLNIPQIVQSDGGTTPASKPGKDVEEPSTVVPQANQAPTEIPVGAAADLEKLFQLPRMDRVDQTRARPVH